MKSCVIQGFLLVASLLPSICIGGAPAASTSMPTLKAIVPADNDILPGQDERPATDALPPLVANKIKPIVSKYYEDDVPKGHDCDPDDCDISEASLYGHIYRLNAPGDQFLYVFVLKAMFNATQYYFMLYDPKKQTITDKPVSIFGKWLDGFYGEKDNPLLQKPFVTFSNIGGRSVLVVEDYGHNGTLYNAALYRYFQLGSDLSLKPILAFERESLWPGGIFNLEGVIQRELKFTKAHSAEISSYFVADSGDKTPRMLGTIYIKSSTDGVFHIAGRKVLDDRFKDSLMTLSETNEDQFIVTGDDLFY